MNMSVVVTLSPESVAAIVAQLRAGTIPGVSVSELLTCEQFAEHAGRSVKWVRARCRTRRIKTVAGRAPYRIPADELRRVLS
jgi:hypothetical protein